MLETPPAIAPHITAFCAEFCPGQTPVYLSLAAEGYAKIDECYINVAEKVKRDGGDVQHGWTVWEWKGVLLEAHFHAVWRAPNGELVDITPKTDGEHRIVFVPDASALRTKS